MKLKIFGLAVVLVLGLLLVTPVAAVKPTANLASAVVVPWHLSADVARIPPFGCADIPGSDTASKLIVNQPNGNTEVALTGVMNGLNPNTEYIVYLGEGYSKTMNRWNIEGDWNLDFIYGSGHYFHTMTVLDQTEPFCQPYNYEPAYFEGTGLSTNQADQKFWDVIGTVNDNSQILFRLVYKAPSNNPGYYSYVTGTIATGTSMVGFWSNAGQSGTWTGTGVATSTPVTDGFPGFGTKLDTFTFMTDDTGAGSWHVNLRDADFDGPDTYKLSVWINSAGDGASGTVLISDNFEVTVEI